MHQGLATVARKDRDTVSVTRCKDTRRAARVVKLGSVSTLVESVDNFAKNDAIVTTLLYIAFFEHVALAEA